MNDLIPSARVEGSILYHGQDLYGPEVDAVEVRKRIGMVFQKPNPFPKSIYDNIAFGPRVLRMKGDMDEIVENALRHAAVWDEVKDRLKSNAFGMSGGQQQRLCIARCLAVEPDVILMDEPCSALDPISTGKIEDLMMDLKQEYSIVIVTHNMQQAARVSDKTAFFAVTPEERVGTLVEFDDTETVFTNPADERTEAYVHGQGRMSTRTHFQEELEGLEGAALGGLDMVANALDRALETVNNRDIELAEHGRSPTTTASTGAIWRCTRGFCAARATGAGGRRPPTGSRLAARHQACRADGRPMRQHGEARAARRARAPGGFTHARPHPANGNTGPPAGDSVRPSFRAPRRRDGWGPGSPGRRDRPPQQGGLPPRARAR